MKRKYLPATAEALTLPKEDILSWSTGVAGDDNVIGVSRGFFVGYEDELEVTGKN